LLAPTHPDQPKTPTPTVPARGSQTEAIMQTSTDWGNAVVVDPRWLAGLRDTNTMLRRTGSALKICVGVLALGCAGGAAISYYQASRISHLSQQVRAYRRDVHSSTAALGALAKSHQSILAATEKAPSIGTSSWGHRFIVTQYIPRSPAYGKYNDGITATLIKADPAARIVAVDPKLIPYGSSVWIEGLGWYRAEDCGSAIKGYRLDVLIATEREAMDYGKQDRFVIVVPGDRSRN
jgi:3D (Asp-Asp-Asp) domain-containing protein